MNWTGSPPFGRRRTLIAALEALEKRKTGPQTIVEVGTSEAFSPDGLGNALLAFGWYAALHGASVHAVDVREGAVANSAELLKRHCPQGVERTRFHRMDAFEFAAFANNPADGRHLGRIDFVYYDAPSEPWSWYVELHGRWAKQFHSGALALFDDTLPQHYNGKGGALIPQLLNDGWRDMQVDGEPVFPMVLLEKL